MPNPKPRILYISSVDPLKGPGAIGMSHYKLLKDSGFEIDMMTLYPVKGHPDIIYVKKKLTIWNRIQRKYNYLTKKKLPQSPYFFFYWKEIHPPVPIQKVLKKITKSYDLVIIYFCQGLLSFQTIDAIFEKLGHPVVFFFSPDYFYISGGCHFPGDCKRYQTGCGCCPAFHSKKENDLTHWNVLYRLKVYEKIKPVVFGNTYMLSFYEKSFLLKDARIVKGKPSVNTNLYRPLDRQKLREKYGIDKKVNFIIAFGCQRLTDIRKGITYLIEALQLFYETLSEGQRNEILLLVAGNSFDTIQPKIPFMSKGLGMISVEFLPEFYSLADIFVCPSVDDAGPSMVGQSISCGTPVVGFEMGALLDWVKGHDTGYCAKLRDSKSLLEGINYYYKMSVVQRHEKSILCRNFALRCSSHLKIGRWMDLYNKYRT